ncbi:MAG: putative phosphomevalonate decarboxylase [Labilithrix sp.]|nr:putative phosphomevalonate decarboxylase [Labilithrix sp.]
MPDRRLGRVLVLRDTQGVTDAQAVLPLGLIPLVARFTGNLTCEEIARAATQESGEDVPVELVVDLATQLEDALYLDGPPYRRARAAVEKAFADAPVRAASHAGGAYHGDPQKLAAYIEKECLAKTAAPAAHERPGQLVALVAPHIDPWRGARCYGEAYGTLGKSLPADVDTFVLFGTSHAPMRQPFALCRKGFATPLGLMDADLPSIDRIAEAADFDPYADQFNHKREHSLEFQAVFLRHLLGDRPARIIPILAGLGAQQSSGASPAETASIERFLGAVRGVVEDKRAVIIAGADLAHVGPRFGDPRAFDEGERRALGQTDRESLDHAVRGDAEGFWRHVSGDLDTRRVCGLAPIYALLRTVAPGVSGHLRHYEQNVDPDEGSIVSHAALGFYA